MSDDMRRAQLRYDSQEPPELSEHEWRQDRRDKLAELKSTRDDLREELRDVCREIHEIEEELDD